MQVNVPLNKHIRPIHLRKINAVVPNFNYLGVSFEQIEKNVNQPLKKKLNVFRLRHNFSRIKAVENEKINAQILEDSFFNAGLCENEIAAHGDHPLNVVNTENSRFKYRLVVAYDGTNFGGWQYQQNNTSVQKLVEEALMIMLQVERKALGMIGSGRTDSGVHAKGQVAHFWTNQEIENLQLFHYKMNQLLPSSISVLEVAQTSPDFHALKSAKSKTYHYFVENIPFKDPLKAPFYWHINNPLDMAAIAQGAAHFVGEHDFTTFANENPFSSPIKVKKILRFDLVEEGEGSFRFEVEGTGFLYRQVRNMVGLLIVIGQHKSPPEVIPKLLKAKNRKLLARISCSAPAHGLRLQKVTYEEGKLSSPGSNNKNYKFKAPKKLKIMSLGDDLKVDVKVIKGKEVEEKLNFSDTSNMEELSFTNQILNHSD